MGDFFESNLQAQLEPALFRFMFEIRGNEKRLTAILVPGHGEVITRDDLAPTMVSMLREAVRG